MIMAGVDNFSSRWWEIQVQVWKIQSHIQLHTVPRLTIDMIKLKSENTSPIHLYTPLHLVQNQLVSGLCQNCACLKKLYRKYSQYKKTLDKSKVLRPPYYALPRLTIDIIRDLPILAKTQSLVDGSKFKFKTGNSKVIFNWTLQSISYSPRYYQRFAYLGVDKVSSRFKTGNSKVLFIWTLHSTSYKTN